MNDDWDEDDFDDFDICDHEDYDADILTGYATCARCGEKWIQTAEELKREREAQAAWDRQCEEWERSPPPPLPPAPPNGDDIPF